MKNHFLTNEKDIVAWLNKYGIKNYSLISDEKFGFVVDVEGSVHLEELGLKSIPVKFNIISGDFICSFNDLRHLKFAPIECRDFVCVENNLTSLKGCPQKVLGSIQCSKNKLTTLEGGPQTVGGDYWCPNNNITSLKGAPRHIYGDFRCSCNPLKSLEHCPKIIEGKFDADTCQLETLDYFPVEVKSGFIYIFRNELLSFKQNFVSFTKIQDFLNIAKLAKKEHNDLNLEVSKIDNVIKTHKI